MTLRELTTSDLQARVGTRHVGTRIVYPPLGLQPYYEWLLQTLDHLAEASVPDLKVRRDDTSDTAIYVMAGRAMVDGVAMVVPAETIDLSFFNNDTALVWLEDDEGPLIELATDATGWPTSPHIKLAEVTLEGGAITQILDRRVERMLSDLPRATTAQRGSAMQAAASSDVAAVTDNSGGTSGSGTIAAISGADSSVINAIATLAAYCNTLAVDLNDLKQKLRDAGSLAE